MKIWTTVAVSVAATMLKAGTAKADFKMWLPDVNFGEVAIETVGDAGFDPHPDRGGEQSQTIELEYGLTHWWQTELELEFERDAGVGQSTYFSQITSENLSSSPSDANICPAPEIVDLKLHRLAPDQGADTVNHQPPAKKENGRCWMTRCPP